MKMDATHVTDLIIKTSIGIAVAVASWHLKSTGDKLEKLQMDGWINGSKIMVLETTAQNVQEQLKRMDRKLDSLLERSRMSYDRSH